MLRRVNGGFTLIELLVVIAILAILAAILFPVFARARSKGYQASCASNLKQIATAIIMYGDDHDGYGPLSHGMGCFEDVEKGDVLPGARCNSALALAAYDGGWADYYVQEPGSPCKVSNWSVNPLWLCNGNGKGTYKMLANRGGTWNMWQVNGSSIAGTVRNPQKAALVGDAWAWQAMSRTPPAVCYGYWWHFVTPRATDDIRVSAPDYTALNYQRYMREYTPHNGGMNMAFCDGHVKWMDAQAMIADMDWWVAAFQ